MYIDHDSRVDLFEKLLPLEIVHMIFCEVYSTEMKDTYFFGERIFNANRYIQLENTLHYMLQWCDKIRLLTHVSTIETGSKIMEIFTKHKFHPYYYYKSLHFFDEYKKRFCPDEKLQMFYEIAYSQLDKVVVFEE